MGMKNKAAGVLKKMLAIFTRAKSLNDLKSKLRDLKTRLMIYSLLSRDKKILFGSVSHKLNILFITNHHQPNDKTKQNDEDEEQINCLHQQLPSPLVVYSNTINVASSPEAVYKEAEDADQTEEMVSSFVTYQEDEEENQEHADNGKNDVYPDLRHSLFDDEDDEYEMGRPGKVIELVKKAKKGEGFKLEDEIDEIADLFIKRFHRNIYIQKQNSFKRRTGQNMQLN